MPATSRRQFMRRTGQVGVGLGLAPAIGAAVGNDSPNERIVIAAIGVGGRGTSLVQGFAARPGVAIATLCDLDPRRGGELASQLAAKQGKAPKREYDYRRVLDDKSIDAVIIATPDHWHGPLTVFACQAGKDVYVEKPCSHNVWEGRKMVEAARRYARVVQVGTQNRSAPYLHEALEYIKSGALGSIPLCKVYNLKAGGPFRAGSDSPAPTGFDQNTWCGPAASRPYNEGRFRGGWHAYWDYSGGDLADDAIHQLDVARWLLGKEFPKAVTCCGGNHAFHDDREVPDTQVATFDLGDSVLTLEQTWYAPYMDKIAGDVREREDIFPYWPQCATRVEFYGTNGLMVLGQHGGGWQVFHGAKTQSRPGEVVAQNGGTVPEVPHKDNFLKCIRDRSRPNADIEHGHRTATFIHLANISYRVGGRRLAFDAQSETITGDSPAAALLKRDYRAPFAIPDKV